MNKKITSLLAGVVAAGAVVAGVVTVGSSAQAASPTITVRSNDFVTALGDTRADGHVTVGDKGIGVATVGTTSTAKAAEYWAYKTPLSSAGTPTLSWVGTVAKPGKQLIVDFDGNGSADGTLVGEDVYGTNWWLTSSAQGFVTDPANNRIPSHSTGFGSTNNGTLAEWVNRNPKAQILDVGFSLGSGIEGSGIITGMTVGEQPFDFAGKSVPPATVTAPVTAPQNVKVTSTDTGSATLTWDVVSGAESYRVYRSDLTQNVGASLDNSIKVEGLKPNTKYTFKVAAQNSAGASDKSDDASGTTKAVNLTVPGHLKCVATSSTAMHCTSDAVTGANRYSWYAAGTGVSNPSTTLVAHGSSDGPFYDVVGLPTHGSVKVAVAADNDTQGPGVRSDAVTVKLK